MPTLTNFIMCHGTECPISSPSKRSFHVTKFYYIKIMIITIAAIVCQYDGYVVNAEYFSSVDSLEKLTGIERGLSKNVKYYLENQEKELEGYRRFIENVKRQHFILEEDAKDYLSNPINAFTLIKRMASEWNFLNEYIKQSNARSVFHHNVEEINKEHKMPDDGELKGAVKGLLRLQKIYNLNPKDLSNTYSNGSQAGSMLSWNDCFNIATQYFDQKEISFALSWFEMAHDKFNKTENYQKDASRIHQKNRLEILEYLALSNYELANSTKSIAYIDEILQIAPNHHTKIIRQLILNSLPKLPRTGLPNKESILFDNYTRLCRGEQVLEKMMSRLNCVLETNGNPYFILAPLKQEYLLRDPEIKLFHGLLNEAQIDEIIENAKNLMNRSTVITNSKNVATDTRISQQAWLPYESRSMKSIYRLVEKITDLNMANAEIMQVLNYGIGGHDYPHLDSLGVENQRKNWIGDRISTNMFYLSEVERGGFTVFPFLNVFSRPVKGAMLSWYNLHKSLDADYRTLHSGCPVLLGSKRISNIWIHSGLQEFLRKCDLKNDAYKSIPYNDELSKNKGIFM